MEMVESGIALYTLHQEINQSDTKYLRISKARFNRINANDGKSVYHPNLV